MNAERLLKHFDRIAEAPDAVPRLRRFILDLAVRGKLVEQDPEDEPAAELLDRIQLETAQSAKAARVKNQDELPAVPDDERLFVVPSSWTWRRIGSIAYVEMGQSPPSEHYNQSGDGVPFYQGKADFGARHPMARYWCTKPIKYAHVGDILLSVRAPVGPTNVADEMCCIGRGLAALRCHAVVDSEFLLKCLKCFESNLEALGFGTTFVAINKKQLIFFLIPIPPLREQHRIVAKVDALMALCDRLEAAQNQRERRRDQLVVASLRQLRDEEGPTPSHQDAEQEKEPDEKDLGTLAPWRGSVFLQHIPRLTTRPEHIKALRQAILNLAVRGRLVPQDPSDVPAAELLKEIEVEKSRLIKDRMIPRSKASIGAAKLSFELPCNWRAIRFDDVCNLVTSGARGWAEYYADSGPKFVRAQNIRFGRLRLDDLACVRPPANNDGKRTQIAKNDIVIVITGAGVTNPALIDRALGEAYVSQHVALIKPTKTALSRWLLLCLMSGAGGRETLIERAYGAGKPGLNLDNIRSLSSPLPPLAEQHRIVAKVDELMAVCDRLEANLTATQADSRRLLEALLQEALAPARQEAA